jgi:phospholipid transport system substrate-binding protein
MSKTGAAMDESAILPGVLRSKHLPIYPGQITIVQSAGSYSGTGARHGAPAAQPAPAGGSGTVQGRYDALLSTMKSGGTLGGSGRFAKLAPVIRTSFDVASMARLSVGPPWSGLSEAQRKEVTESYSRYISAIYADPFDSDNGQKLEVTGEQPAPFGLLVKSRIIKSNGGPVEASTYPRRRRGTKRAAERPRGLCGEAAAVDPELGAADWEASSDASIKGQTIR